MIDVRIVTLYELTWGRNLARKYQKASFLYLKDNRMWKKMIAEFLIVLSLFFGFLSICVRYFYKKQFQYWKKLNVPHTKPRFPLGDIGRICLHKSPGEVIGDLYHRSRGHRYLGVWFWFTPTLIIRDPELIRNILVKDFTYFYDRVSYVNVRRDPLSGHLFSLRGSRWRNLRPKLTPAFTSGRMKHFFETFVNCSDKLVETLAREMGKDGIVDMRELAARFTTDITIAYSLGVRPSCLEDRNSIFRKMGKKVFNTSMYNCFHQLVPLLLSNVAKLLAVKPTPSEVSSFFLDAVKKSLKYRENSAGTGRDFMQSLVDLKTSGKLLVVDRDADEDDKNLDWDFTSSEAAAQAYIFFIAGFETSSLIMQYALYEMSVNPAIQDKAREEVMSVLDNYGGKITYDSLNDMEYLNKIIQETLRKYPVVPLVFRTCTKDYPVPDSDFVIPKGMQVQISVYGIHRDPDNFPEPDRFDPERFSEDEKSKRHNYSYLPFGDGPRNCIGMRFSLLQKKVGLAALLSNYKFEVSHRTVLPLTIHPNSFFFAPQGGMHLKVTKL